MHECEVSGGIGLSHLPDKMPHLFVAPVISFAGVA